MKGYPKIVRQKNL